MRLLRRGGIPDAPFDSRSAPTEVVSPQDLKRELVEFKEAHMVTENMLALFVTSHSTVSADDAKIILEVRELMQQMKLLMAM